MRQTKKCQIRVYTRARKHSRGVGHPQPCVRDRMGRFVAYLEDCILALGRGRPATPRDTIWLAKRVNRGGGKGSHYTTEEEVNGK